MLKIITKKRSIAVILLLLFILIASYLRPSVTIYNQTSRIVYLYSGTGKYGVEPNDEEVEESIRPRKILPGENIKIIISVAVLLKKEKMRFDAGWDIGNRAAEPSDFLRWSGQSFMIEPNTGICATSIFIREDKVTQQDGSKRFCYKKLRVLDEKEANFIQ